MIIKVKLVYNHLTGLQILNLYQIKYIIKI